MRAFARLVITFACVSTAIVAAGQSVSRGSWAVRLADGTDTRLTVSYNSGELEFRAAKSVAFTIPASSITEILHSTQPIHRSTQAYNYFENLCCGGTRSELLPVLAAAVARPFGSSRRHYVEIHWYMNGDGASVLEIEKDEYLGFMDWLQSISGVKWVDVAKETEIVLSNIQKHTGGAFPVTIGHPSAESLLVLPVDSHDEKQLYFFGGKVEPKNLVGIVPVTEDWSENRCVRESNVLYRNCDQGRCEIEAIMLPEATFRVMSPASMTQIDAAADVPSDCVRLAEQEKNWRRQEIDSRVTLQATPQRKP